MRIKDITEKQREKRISITDRILSRNAGAGLNTPVKIL